MNVKLIFASMLAVTVALTSCSSDNENEPKGPGVEIPDNAVAYVSFNVQTPTGEKTRASEEQQASPAENEIKTLYAITFDGNEKEVHYENVNPAQQVTLDAGDATKPEPICVTSKAKKLLLIANPGEELLARLNNCAGLSFEDVNAAVTSTKQVGEITGTHGFTMINEGNRLVNSDTDLTFNSELCLVDIAGKMQLVGDGDGQHPTADEAINEAKKDGNRITVGLERLAAKVLVKVKTPAVDSPGATFEFKKWTLDAVNSKFYPWAKKVRISEQISNPQFYANNFYTIDPNYDNDGGIIHNTVDNIGDNATYNPVNVTWYDKDQDGIYVIENTMRAGEQKFKNTTRVVILANYFPDGVANGADWFSFAGKVYHTFAELQTAYDVPENKNLQNACDRFFDKVKAFLDKHNLGNLGGITDFKLLTKDHLDLVSTKGDIGGELVKEDNCIRWYQKGKCYYWYEIRHGEDDSNMVFSKYGVVRNNWYNLTVNSVSNPGTPWYPDIKKPGDGDPDPEDPIDEMEGYIGVSVEVAPWIKWDKGIDL
ncbi:MAG: Mfa1 family fimbria major subunit [Bacteroides sp.]|nr:Mfa1 family fimbria major subunit [Bacteroides sp.]